MLKLLFIFWNRLISNKSDLLMFFGSFYVIIAIFDDGKPY
jgi:hypothetical protein